jgi:3',5'-cyclic-AMP phosphodiesterase
MKIVHLSDLHLSGLNFIPDWGESVVEMVNEIIPNVVIVTGDLTDDGYEYEYEIAKDYLDWIKVDDMLVVPGNHDARNEGYRLFESIFGSRFPWYEDDNTYSIGYRFIGT